MTERAAFGLELQRLRERRGLSLDELAACTKISGSLFAGLERGDVSRWPSGIFRRAFVRAYAQAIGLDSEDTVGRFLRLYPDADGTAIPAVEGEPPAAEAVGDSAAPRLVLDEASAQPVSAGAWRTARRVGAPVVDLLVAGIPACLVSLLFGWQWFWVVAGAVGLVGHLLVLSLAGVTPGTWLLIPRPTPPTLATDPSALARRRVDPEAVLAPLPRRRQQRHASGSRPVATARPHRLQH